MDQEKDAPLDFESKVEDIGPCKKKIGITVAKESVQERYEKDFGEIQKTVILPGFRKGHVPRKLLERKVGKDLVGDLKEAIVQECYEKVLEEKELKPFVPPNIDYDKLEFKPEDAFHFEITVEVKPDFKLSAYTAIPASRPSVSVTKNEVEKELEILQRRMAKVQNVGGRGIEAEDLVNCTAQFLHEGENLLTREDCRISSRFRSIEGVEIPDYEKHLFGRKVGEVVEIPITLPENFLRKELGGGSALLQLKINEVSEFILPEASDEWAKEHDYESLKDLQDDLKKTIRLRKDQDADRAVENQVIATLLEKHPFDLPMDFVEREAEEAILRMKVNLKMDGKPEEEVEGELTKLRQSKKEEIIKDFKESLLLEKISDKEKIFVTEDEIQNHIIQIAQTQGQNPQLVKDYFEQNNMITTLRFQIRERKVREFLREKAEIQKTKGEK